MTSRVDYYAPDELPLPTVLPADSEPFQLAVFLVRQLANKREIVSQALQGAATLKTTFENPFAELQPAIFDPDASDALVDLAASTGKINAVLRALVSTLLTAESELTQYALHYSTAAIALNSLSGVSLKRLLLMKPPLLNPRPHALPTTGDADSEAWVQFLRNEFTDEQISFAVAKTKNVVLRTEAQTSAGTAANVGDAAAIMAVLSDLPPPQLPPKTSRADKPAASHGRKDSHGRPGSATVAVRRSSERDTKLVTPVQRRRYSSGEVSLKNVLQRNHEQTVVKLTSTEGPAKAELHEPDDALMLSPVKGGHPAESGHLPGVPTYQSKQRRPSTLAIENSIIFKKREGRQGFEESRRRSSLGGAHIPTTMPTTEEDTPRKDVVARSKAGDAHQQAECVAALLDKIALRDAGAAGLTPRTRAQSIRPEDDDAIAGVRPSARTHIEWLDVFQANSSAADGDASAGGEDQSFQTARVFLDNQPLDDYLDPTQAWPRHARAPAGTLSGSPVAKRATTTPAATPFSKLEPLPMSYEPVKRAQELDGPGAPSKLLGPPTRTRYPKTSTPVAAAGPASSTLSKRQGSGSGSGSGGGGGGGGVLATMQRILSQGNPSITVTPTSSGSSVLPSGDTSTPLKRGNAVEARRGAVSSAREESENAPRRARPAAHERSLNPFQSRRAAR